MCSLYLIYAAIAPRPSKLRELRTRYKFEQYEEAVKAYDRAIELDPMDIKTFYGKGFALNKLKRYEEAIVACDRAIQLDPKNSLAFYNKGYTLGRLATNGFGKHRILSITPPERMPMKGLIETGWLCLK